ncbi:MAG: MBL fold metallo-hydrolase [Lachnospiraceae bacterium]|nr:MBL fold metallo-hydrolase [Lachnospiraceae bacterium]
MGNEINYTVSKVNDDTWIIEEGGVRFFLLKGTDKALLIDSGMMIRNARDIAASLTDLPVSLLNTHADMDHIGSVGQFESFYMHPDEEENFRQGGREGTIIPVNEGDVLDLGGRKLEIIHLPGHTPGSIAILDVNNRVLISGDPIQDGHIFMFGTFRNMEKYVESLEHLQAFEDRFDEIWPSHATLPADKALIGQLIEAAKKILAGEAEDCAKEEEFHGNKLKAYDFGFATLLCGRD